MPSIEEIYKQGGTLTWFNHFSVMQCMNKGVNPAEFDAVGFDGQFLRWLLGNLRFPSSADIDLPNLIRSKSPSVGLIGGTEVTCAKHQKYFQNAFPDAQILWNFNGYGESQEAEATKTMKKHRPDLILIGMGPGLQEIEAIRIQKLYSGQTGKTLIATCGGWLDQLGVKNYYTEIAKNYNLRWVFRLARDPLRLWKRYTIYGLIALFRREEIRAYCAKSTPLNLADK